MLNLTFEFKTPEERALFISFFCNFGEQTYWDWTSGKEGEVNFDYPHYKHWKSTEPEIVIKTTEIKR